MNEFGLKSTCALFALFLSGQALAETTYGDLIVTKLVRVYDGDTIYVDVETLPAMIGSEMPIRIRGVDTPEIKKPKCEKERELGFKAKAFVEERLQTASRIELLKIGRGKWFRIAADVVYDGKRIAEEIITAGHGVVYDEKKKKDWCAD